MNIMMFISFFHPSQKRESDLTQNIFFKCDNFSKLAETTKIRHYEIYYHEYFYSSLNNHVPYNIPSTVNMPMMSLTVSALLTVYVNTPGSLPVTDNLLR